MTGLRPPFPRLYLGDAEITAVAGGGFRLDGGAMFGLVPRPVWEECCEPDERHRIQLACNCLLVRQGRDAALVDAGPGQRFTEKERDIYAVDRQVDLGASLLQAGVRPEEVTQVVFTHLHFDHFCGALAAVRGRLAPLFPNAAHLVQRGEWEDALAGRSTMRASYRAAELGTLAEQVEVRLIEGDVRITEGLFTWVTGGHTQGHQGVRFQAGEQVLAYPADILPTQWHVNPYWGTAYDMFPYETLQCKMGLLPRITEEGWLLAWNHDPQAAWGHLRYDGKRYAAVCEG